MKRIIALVLLLIALLVALYLVTSFLAVRPLTGARSPGVEVRTEHLFEEGSTYSIDVQYPKLGIAAIDDQIAQEVQQAASDIRSYPANPPDSATPKNSLTGTFDRVYVGPDYVSVELVLSQYTGGAHGLTNFDGLSFDRASGRRLTLDDALKLTGLTIEQLSTQASSTIAAKLGDAFMFPEGVAPSAKNFSSFVVSEHDVAFIFEPYQVAPYAAGPQEVVVPRVH